MPLLVRPVRALARAAARLVRHPVVDRAIGGRWSIVVIAFALIGIVTLQLGLLKLNVGVGRSLERERTLERENATLGIENAELGSPERIRDLAARLGMTPVALTELRFLRAKHGFGGSAGAASRLRAPVHPAGETETRSSTGTGAETEHSEAASSEAGSSEAGSSEAGSSEATGTEATGTETAGSEAASSGTNGAEAPSSGAEASSSAGEAATAEAVTSTTAGSEAGEGG
ncbi:MAG TPA: hypothetical protein VMI13_02815 [Solirubrobacteraceae bacterium]|nr:hypothetical protein [Solirubrobacteraceae bacterium]